MNRQSAGSVAAFLASVLILMVFMALMHPLRAYAPIGAYA